MPPKGGFGAPPNPDVVEAGVFVAPTVPEGVAEPKAKAAEFGVAFVDPNNANGALPGMGVVATEKDGTAGAAGAFAFRAKP
jgi:hypothetical protein